MSRVSSTSEVESFQYGDQEDAAMLSVSVRVYHCAACDLSFTTEEASESRHEAVCRHLGILTPTEVRGVRERCKLSQADFAELSKIGKASLARWERGALFQNQANDNLLYLLTFDDNVVRLRERARLRNASTVESETNVIFLAR
ncbi:MAG: helix-turn-helix domain-containing protein [Magnetococcales bacterium]|nr:helix-turn-helix domain-containing protein [Magnetococcales bacterium]